jgi:hypothetical protein
MVDCPVIVQISAASVPSTPSWLGEVTLITHHLSRMRNPWERSVSYFVFSY